MPKILVADDNANIQKMVVLAFEERGIQVVTAANGEAAVRRIPDLNPDLILADIFMPVRNGYEVCEFVKKDTRFSHIPVILLVGAFDPLDEKEARRVGADGVLKKPFVPPDPLIAMVMSALEKIPSVVAEFAKAKEAKEAPPEPLPQLAIPARPEPKPLPEFPEPSTPEEAALAYGFGKNVRGLDKESLAGQKAPISEIGEEDETEEAGFDGASTSRDWRRDAMDFEVPMESANKPAFSSIEDFEPVKFPTEAEHPPRRVRLQAPEPRTAGEETVAQSVAAESAPVQAIVVANEVVQAATVEVEAEAPAAVAQAEPAMEATAAAPEFIEAPSEPVATPEPVSDAAPAPASESENYASPISAAAPEPAAESSEPASVPHWMDALSPAFQSRPASGAWLDSISGQAPFGQAISNRAEESLNSVMPSASTVESVEAHADASAVAIVEEAQAPAPTPTSDIDAPLVVESPVAIVEPAAPAPEASWFAPAPPVFDRFDENPVSAPVPVMAAEPDRALELDNGGHEPPLAFKDPNLVEPTAVRVTPEPLLVNDDEIQGPSGYGSQAQETSPLHSFCAPPVEEPVAEEAFAGREEIPVAVAAPQTVSASDEVDERIPTAPPPNREALSGIPFLTPPADFHEQVREAANSNNVDVDDVVRKVLEKLEPQLHELLSRGLLKPLVENLLQSELAKKNK